MTDNEKAIAVKIFEAGTSGNHYDISFNSGQTWQQLSSTLMVEFFYARIDGKLDSIMLREYRADRIKYNLYVDPGKDGQECSAKIDMRLPINIKEKEPN